jgi:hypothetical protein
MTKHIRHPLVLAAAVLCAWAASALAQSSAPVANPVSVTATVRSVSKEPREIELVTGVGYALRAVKLRLPEAAEVRSMTGLVARDQLKPGDVVRAEYVKGADGNTVTKITILGSPEAGGGR